MSSYSNILDHVRRWEGGEVYFENEKQWTNRGVQWTTYKALAPKLLGIANPTVEGLRSMSADQADKFIVQFWNTATDNSAITNQASANAFFEMLWGGGRSGIKWLQKVIGVYPDGRVGSKTVAAANKFDPETLLKEVLKRYEYLAKTNPSEYGEYNESKQYFVKGDDLLKKSVENNTNSNILQVAAVFSVGFVLYKLITK